MLYDECGKFSVHLASPAKIVRHSKQINQSLNSWNNFKTQNLWHFQTVLSRFFSPGALPPLAEPDLGLGAMGGLMGPSVSNIGGGGGR